MAIVKNNKITFVRDQEQQLDAPDFFIKMGGAYRNSVRIFISQERRKMNSQGERANVLAEMNEFLNRKDELFAAREKAIEEKFEKLTVFEERLLEQATSLKKEKETLQKEREAFAEEVEETRKKFESQKAEIDAKWQEVYDYEENCQAAMERLVAEELKGQLQEMQKLEQQLNQEQTNMSDSEKYSALETLMGELEGVTTKQEAQEESILNSFEKVHKKVFPNSYVAEKKNNRLCITVGTREIRIFAGEQCEIHIVEKKESNKMDSEVVYLNRLQTEWTFNYKDNHLMAVKALDEKTVPETVLRQAKKAISEYFK